MDLVQSLSWVDLAIILVLAVGVFAGFTQGTIVYVLNSLALLVAFIVAAQLKGPYHRPARLLDGVRAPRAAS